MRKLMVDALIEGLGTTRKEAKKWANYQELVDRVRDFMHAEAPKTAYTHKKGLVTDRIYKGADNVDYEERAAYLLEELREEGKIKDWFPTKPYGVLDALKVDFVIVIEGNDDDEVVLVQVTSNQNLGRIRRRDIKRKYPLKEDKPVIAVVQLVTYGGNMVSDDKVKQRFMDAVKETPPVPIGEEVQFTQSRYRKPKKPKEGVGRPVPAGAPA